MRRKTISNPRSATRKSGNKSSCQHLFKTVLLLSFLFIVCLYSFLLSRIMSKMSRRNTIDGYTEHGRSFSSSSISSSEANKSVLIIAAVPYQSVRSLSLWSQLQCFTGKIDKVIIAAADYTKELLDPFVTEAVQAIPHLSHGKTEVEVKYYKNDRYDIGLWCDALNDGNVLNDFDEFLLINDSLMAIRESTEMIDVMRSKKLTMGSLTYSLLGGYWLEAGYRGFNPKGVKKLMETICVPNSCEKKKKINRKHRCMVDTFEIPIAGLFERNEVWGLYHGDAPIEYFNATAKNKKLQTSPMWHSNYPYWDEVLRAQQDFPAVKISNRWAYSFLTKRNKEDHDRCLTLMDKSEKVGDMVKQFDALMENADSVNQLQYRKGCQKSDSFCKKS